MVNECLSKVFQKLQKIHPFKCHEHLAFSSSLGIHDNTPACRARDTVEFFNSSGVKVLEHPAYSSGLAPYDFDLFPIVKDQFKEGSFQTDTELLAATDQACSELP